MVTINDLIEGLSLKVIVKGDANREVRGCYISDLLSDVMANSSEGQTWITLQTHPNIVPVAIIKNLSGIIITNNRTAEADTIKKAEEENITILSTSLTTFEIAGLLYKMLKG